jgi:protein subunit release factor A
VNKTNNCAVLLHKPSGIRVVSHESRTTETNKHYCLKKLKEELDIKINGENSKKIMKLEKI